MLVPFARFFDRLPQFLATGAVATAAHWAVMALLIQQGIRPVLATAVGASVGLVLAYAGHYHVTFHASGRHRDLFPGFLLMASIGWLVNLLVFFLLSATVLTTLWAQVFATACATLCNYMTSRLLVFTSLAPARDQHS